MTESQSDESNNDDRLKADIAGLKRAIELCSEVLFEQALAFGSRPQLSIRESIFYSSCARCLRTARAVQVLFDSGYIEEMNMLMRPLAEGVINACFLQICTEEEIKAFTSFDSIAHFRDMTKFENLRGGWDKTSAEFSALQSNADQAASFSGRTERDLGWTSKGVNKRAEEVDNELSEKYGPETSNFQLLVHTVYSSGHSYVHYTFHSLRSHLAPKSIEHLREARYSFAAVYSALSNLSLFGRLIVGFKSDPRSDEADALVKQSFGTRETKLKQSQ